MITTENKYFLRIILLLYDAASFILRHIVVRELEKHGGDLDNLLTKDAFKNKLKHKLHFGKSQVEKLFPSNCKSDIRTWDSQMLAVVSLLIFRSTLSSDEKYHIKFIKLTRNNVAHKPSASYLEDDFVDEKDGIVKAITILASSFDSTVQGSCSKLISSYCSDPLDVQLAIEHLEEDTTNRELLRQILDAVNQKHELVCNDIKGHAERIENKINLTEKKICESQETVLTSLKGLSLGICNVESKVTESKEKSSQELKQINASLTNQIVNEAEKVSQKVDSNSSFLLQEVQRNHNKIAAKLDLKLEEMKQAFKQIPSIGGHCSKQIKFGTHTHLTVDGPTQEWINIVETVLKSVFDLLLNEEQEPGQNPETERAVKEFLNFIKGFKGVHLKAVNRKCILLAFECLTFESLMKLIEFINSNEFLSYLESIARALEKDLQIPEQILFSSEIPVSSLQLVVDDKSSIIKNECEKGIELSFECTSINGLDAFWRLFVKGEATPYIDKIAATLSSEVREKTSLSTSVNLQEFEDALSDLEATMKKAKDTVILKPKKETTQQSSDSEKDIDTLETMTAYTSQDSHTTGIDHWSVDIQPGLKQPSAKQDICDFEPQDKRTNHSWFSSYRQSSYRKHSFEAAYKSQDSHTTGIDHWSLDIQPELKQPSAKQDICDLKPQDKRTNRSWYSSYRQSSNRKHSFEAGKLAEPSRTYKPLCYNKHSDSNPRPPSSPLFYQPIIVEQDSEATYGEASFTDDLESSVIKNSQDELTGPDPLNSVCTLIQDTKSEDIKEHSEINGKSYQHLASSFKERKYQHEIKEHAGTRYSKHHLRRLTEKAKLSSSHHFDRFSLVYQEEIDNMILYFVAYNKIYSCAILSDERLILAYDHGLSVVNIHTGRVEQKKDLYGWHADIAVLPNDRFAVTLPCDDEVVILSTNDMSLIRSIPGLKHPRGITYHQYELYVVCLPHYKGLCVQIINLQGVLLREIECDKISLFWCPKIAVSMDAQNLYITDYTSGLIRYSAQGQVIARYRFSGSHPKSLKLLGDGSLQLVSAISRRYYDNHTIHHISADLQQGYELKLDERYVRCIGVHPVNNKIYVISYDTIKVYYMQKQ